MSENVINMIAMAILTGVVIGVLSMIIGYIKDFKKKKKIIDLSFMQSNKKHYLLKNLQLREKTCHSIQR